jgi:hypothetical protein
MNDRPNIVTPALVGGVALGITSALPLVNFVNCACCALVIGGGVLAAHLFLRDYPPHFPPVTYGDGAVLGVLTGVFGGFVWTVVELPLSFFKLRLGGGFAEMGRVREALDDPNIPPMLREFLVNLAYAEGLTLAMAIFSVAVNLMVSVVFATIGAIIGVALFGKRPSYPVPPRPAP